MYLFRVLVLFFAMLPLTVLGATNSTAKNTTANTPAANTTPNTASQELSTNEMRLQDETAALVHVEEQLKRLEEKRAQQKIELQDTGVNNQLVAKAELALASARVKVENLKIEISNSEQQLTATLAYLNDSDNSILNIPAVNNQNELSTQAHMADLIRERIRIQKNQLTVWQQIQEIEQDWLASLRGVVSTRVAEDRAADYQAVAAAILQEQADLTRKIAEYNEQAARLQSQGDTESQQLRLLEYNIEEVEERTQFLSLKLSLVQIFPKMVQLHQIRDGVAIGVFSSWKISDESGEIKTELQSLQSLLKRKLDLLKERQSVNQKYDKQKPISIRDWQRESQLLNDLISEYTQLESSAQSLLAEIQGYQGALEHAYKLGLVTRYTLPTDLTGWKSLWQDLTVFPVKIIADLHRVGLQIQVFWQHSQLWNKVLLIANEVAWVLLMLGIWHWLQRLLQPRGKGRVSFSGNTALLFAKLVQTNVVGIALFGIFFWQLILINGGAERFNIWLSLMLGWASFKLPLGIARLSLLLNTENTTGRDVRLYRGLRFAFAVAGVFVTITLLAHRLELSKDILALTDRIFMLVLLALSYPLLREWRVVPNLLAPYVGERRYLQRGILILSLALPLALLSNAAIGLVGYVNLAWRIGIIEFETILFLVVMVIAWGMIGDVMDILSNFFIRRVANGWLWTQAILKPLHKVVNLGIIAGGLFGFVEILPRGQRSPIFQSLQNLLLAPIFTLGKSDISTWSLIKFVLAFAVVMWAARWSREFSYRWLFHKSKDSGIRNSLSVFTQYATVIIGFLFMLTVAGIDLSTLTIVASALAVGLGFGLRDIMSNFVSGFLLLIERPMRTGDRIEVNGAEGEVTHIGMRATKIRNSQNMEVIIPNSTTINQTFVNLTHNDTVVGSEITLHFGLEQNPEIILNLLKTTLIGFPGILTEPPVEVYCREFSEYYMNFLIRYYLDVRKTVSRSGKRSEVLLHLWRVLKDANIKLAYPHKVIDIKNIDALRNNPIEDAP